MNGVFIVKAYIINLFLLESKFEKRVQKLIKSTKIHVPMCKYNRVQMIFSPWMWNYHHRQQNK